METGCGRTSVRSEGPFHAHDRARAGASVTTPADPFCTDTWVQGEEARP